VTIPILIFYHCVFRIDDKPLPAARSIVHEQMQALRDSGLEDAASEIHVGINGTDITSGPHALGLLPQKAEIRFHGDQCRNELRTLLMIEDLCKTHEGEAYILSFHSKGASHPPDSDYAKLMSTPWRNRMMFHLVQDWRRCVMDLRNFEAVGCHWLTQQGWDKSQHYFAGTFFWTRASFFRTIPSVITRQRIKDSGIDSYDSRFEAEVHLGNGPRLPKIKDYYNGRIGS
jgi:hypothetical protein